MILETHNFPLIPGSFNVIACCLEMGYANMIRNSFLERLMRSSVFRSHLVDVGESHRVCHKVVLTMKGSWGTRKRRIVMRDTSSIMNVKKSGDLMEESTKALNRKTTRKKHCELIHDFLCDEFFVPLVFCWSD